MTVQGPVKEQQPDGMSHRGGGEGGRRQPTRAPSRRGWPDGPRSSPPDGATRGARRPRSVDCHWRTTARCSSLGREPSGGLRVVSKPVPIAHPRPPSHAQGGWVQRCTPRPPQCFPRSVCFRNVDGGLGFHPRRTARSLGFERQVAPFVGRSPATALASPGVATSVRHVRPDPMQSHGPHVAGSY